ncbi:MAG: hypothetical protein KAF91_23205 [Nostoc sp. TH1S01]|nr:hypothetical protein [Nostoc sp. TH1S01]
MIKAKALVVTVSGAIAFYGNVAIANINQDINLPNSATVNQEQVTETTPKFPSKYVSEVCLINGKWVAC